MKLQDLFVPRWQHSNPEVRKRAVAKLRDPKVLKQILEMDEDPVVRDVAMVQLSKLPGQQVHVKE